MLMWGEGGGGRGGSTRILSGPLHKGDGGRGGRSAMSKAQRGGKEACSIVSAGLYSIQGPAQARCTQPCKGKMHALD